MVRHRKMEDLTSNKLGYVFLSSPNNCHGDEWSLMVIWPSTRQKDQVDGFCHRNS